MDQADWLSIRSSPATIAPQHRPPFGALSGRPPFGARSGRLNGPRVHAAHGTVEANPWPPATGLQVITAGRGGASVAPATLAVAADGTRWCCSARWPPQPTPCHAAKNRRQRWRSGGGASFCRPPSRLLGQVWGRKKATRVFTPPQPLRPFMRRTENSWSAYLIRPWAYGPLSFKSHYLRRVEPQAETTAALSQTAASCSAGPRRVNGPTCPCQIVPSCVILRHLCARNWAARGEV